MHRCFFASILSACLAASGGCGTAPRTDAFVVADGQELPILREVSGTFSSFGQSMRLVVHDPATLASLPINVGDVDFDSEMVLVAALGPAPSEQYAIRIQRVWRDGACLRAPIVVTYPPAGAPLRSRPASPYDAVVVPNSPLNVGGFRVKPPPASGRLGGRGF